MSTSPKEQVNSKTHMLRQMMRIRCIEETLADRYKEQEMRTPTHFSIGQEATAVGVCGALRRDDLVYSGHRCHAHYLAKGGDLMGLVAELYGRASGCSGGRGGSVHLNDSRVGFVAASAILGETLAVAAGSAWALDMKHSSNVAVAFFGDAVVEEGIFHETLNFAAVRKVPAIFVCENNLYSTQSPLSVRQPVSVEIWQRAQGYAIPAQKVDGNDVIAVRRATETAVAHCRGGNGPYFLELSTYRWREHVGPNWDYELGYRSREELEAWMLRCPIQQITATILEAGLSSEDELAQWQQTCQAEIDRVIDAARRSAFPAPEQLLDGTW